MKFGVEIPFVNLLGFDLVRFEGGHSEIVYEPLPVHMNSFAVTHGGALMTLLDVSMATAARSILQDMGVVTIEMKTSFMRPASGVLHGHGQLMHRTKSMAFVQGEIRDASGALCAHASGTFKYVPRRTADPLTKMLPPLSTD